MLVTVKFVPNQVKGSVGAELLSATGAFLVRVYYPATRDGGLPKYFT